MMKTLFSLGHPAHFHLFKNVIKQLEFEGHEVEILIKKKDILEDLLAHSSVEYNNILPHGRSDGKLGILTGLIKKNIGLYKHCKVNRPDLMLGTSAEIAHIGKLLGIPSVVFSEDDVSVIRSFATLTYPFANHVMSPDVCENGRWNSKTIFYSGFHKLAYLHPNHFNPDYRVLQKYGLPKKSFVLLRFAKLTAHHDEGITGITDEIAEELIDLLTKHGNVYISSERELPLKFEPYRLKIDPLDIHHFLAYAKLFIGDSQSMAVEAAMLGTPSIRFSSFAGRISVLEELEHKYKLTQGIKPDNPEELYAVVDKLLTTPNLRDLHETRKQKMLSEKIDVTAFFKWFIINYPESFKTITEDPDYQKRFMDKNIQAKVVEE